MEPQGEVRSDHSAAPTAVSSSSSPAAGEANASSEAQVRDIGSFEGDDGISERDKSDLRFFLRKMAPQGHLVLQ